VSCPKPTAGLLFRVLDRDTAYKNKARQELFVRCQALFILFHAPTPFVKRGEQNYKCLFLNQFSLSSPLLDVVECHHTFFEIVVKKILQI